MEEQKSNTDCHNLSCIHYYNFETPDASKAMSEPAANTSAVVLHHHHHQPTPPPPPTAAASPSSPPSPYTATTVRDYRKGNWTIQETLTLINAKRLDEERRVQRQTSGGGGGVGGGPGTPRTAELRWKWVENYCWKQGCMRSQNQCNDKWDNLLRDYKKVRDYEAKAAVSLAGDQEQLSSYWSMEKQERKERNLPSNLAAEVFDALTDVLSRRNANRSGVSAAATPVSYRVPPLTLPPPTPPPAPPVSEQQPPPLAQPLPPPAPPPPPLAVPAQPSVSVEISSETSGTEDEGNSGGLAAGTGEGRTKRRRIGGSVVRGASVLARTLIACEEKREKRHRDLIELEQRRLRIEEDRTEMTRQGFAGLIAAVNTLSGAIHALVSQHHHH